MDRPESAQSRRDERVHKHGLSWLARGVLTTAVLLVTAFGGPALAQDQQLPVVTGAKPVVRQIVEDDEFVGRFDAVDQVAIRSRVSGYLDKVGFQDGALVKTGDLLFTIDQRPYKAAYDAAKSQVDVAKSLLEFSKMQLDRAEELAKSGNISTATVDDRRREYLSAQAQMQGATAALTTASLEHGVHRDQGADIRPHRPPAGVGRKPRAAGFHLADDDRHTGPDRLLLRCR